MTQTIITNSFRGGTGKSTVISNLGTFLATLGHTVMIIDADIISPGVHAIFGYDQKSFDTTLTDFLKGGVDYKDIVYDISSTVDLAENSLYLIPSSMERGEIVELLQEKKRIMRLSKALLKFTDEYKPDYILVDTHPGLNEEFLVLLEDVNMLFNIVRPDNQDYQGLEVTSAITKRLGVKNYVILNKVHSKLNKSKLRKSIEKAYKMPVGGVLPFSEDLMLAQSQYVFSERKPEHEFTQGIQEIAADVFGVKKKKHLEIMHDILAQVRDAKALAVSKVYVPNTPQKTCDSYVKEMLKGGFLDKSGDKVSITAKGQKSLKKYGTISKFVDNFRV
jgi:MinD-like ATPase involved in chromosome partitioning or flagellar assembly